MLKNKFFFIDCNKAENCCDKSQYKEAGMREKFSMLLHLMLCRPCRKYSSKNTRLTKLIEKSGIKNCTKEEKEVFRHRIQKEMSKQKS